MHHLGNDNGTLGSFDINAHGIAAYGDDPHHPITGLRIDHDTVDHLHLGASETVVVNGNVDGWRITDNHIFKNNNIGIDAIGFEPTLTGKYRYTDREPGAERRDRAQLRQRHPLEGQPVLRARTAAGATAPTASTSTEGRASASRTTVSPATTSASRSRPRTHAGTRATSSSSATTSPAACTPGITTGGYCDGGSDCGGVQTGSSYDNLFADNVLRGNNQLNDGSPELLVQYRAHDDRFLHNSITATNSEHVVIGTVARDQGGQRNVSDHNRFAAVGATAADVRFGWRGTTYTGFAAYRAATGQDRHSVLVG